MRVLTIKRVTIITGDQPTVLWWRWPGRNRWPNS
jgi:hypothetical protein